MANVPLTPPYTIVGSNDGVTTTFTVMVPAPPPVAPPVVTITTLGGNTTQAQQVISGTVDLPNVGLPVLVDAGPTSFGTTIPAANGTWQKTITMNVAGTWTITAHSTNAAGTGNSNSIVFNYAAAGPTPPVPITRVPAGATVAQIQAAMNIVTSPGSLVFSAGAYNFAGQSVRGKSNITIWADGNVIINGAPTAGGGAFDMMSLTNWTITGPGPGSFVFNNTLINATGTNLGKVANSIFNNSVSNGFDGSSIRMSNASYLTVLNNDFTGCQGNVLGMYDIDNITIDGNHFVNCNQPISFQTPTTTNRSLGRNIAVRNNVFIGCTRAAMEMGPASTGAEYFGGTVVENNWFDAWNNPDASTILAISLVGQASENTTVRNNYMSRGMGPNSLGKASPGIEVTGTGECSGNVIVDFTWAGFTYQSGWNVHNNTHWVTPGQPNFTPSTAGWANNGSGSGTFANNVEASAKPPIPPQPPRTIPLGLRAGQVFTSKTFTNSREPHSGN